MIFGYAVEFIGNESKAELIGSVKATDRFENRAAESCVARRISREGWREVWPHQVTRGRAQRCEGWVAKSGVVAITAAGRDRKSTRLNSSHSQISYAVFCLKKKKPKLHRN